MKFKKYRIGKKISAIINSGSLVSDDIVSNLIEKAISNRIIIIK